MSVFIKNAAAKNRRLLKKFTVDPSSVPTMDASCAPLLFSPVFKRRKFMEPQAAVAGADPQSDTISVCTSSDHDAESDKMSMVSETDSGVVCSASRPNSFILGYSASKLQQQHARMGVGAGQSPLCLQCPQCRQVCHFDESGAHGAPRNKALANVVLRSEKPRIFVDDNRRGRQQSATAADSYNLIGDNRRFHF
uniref:Uncharacterized protein n=1 Tax=Romanomermis culicivorax TaxID=13658 RepID=A0A915IWS8_ROMCU